MLIRQPIIAQMPILRLTLILLLLLSGCSSPLKPHPELVHEQMPFIRDGETMQQELVARLGAPTHQYEKGRILIYGLRQDDKGHLQVLPLPGQSNGAAKRPLYLETYNLVLVFDIDGVLNRHALLQIK